MVNELFQKLLVAEKRIRGPGGFEVFEERQLLVRSHGDFRIAARSQCTQRGRLCKTWTQTSRRPGTRTATKILKHKAALSATLCFKSHVDLAAAVLAEATTGELARSQSRSFMDRIGAGIEQCRDSRRCAHDLSGKYLTDLSVQFQLLAN